MRCVSTSQKNALCGPRERRLTLDASHRLTSALLARVHVAAQHVDLLELVRGVLEAPRAVALHRTHTENEKLSTRRPYGASNTRKHLLKLARGVLEAPDHEQWFCRGRATHK